MPEKIPFVSPVAKFKLLKINFVNRSYKLLLVITHDIKASRKIGKAWRRC